MHDKGKLALVMYVYVDGIFMEGKTDTLENLKELIKLKFNIQESKKLKRFLGYIINGTMVKRILKLK